MTTTHWAEVSANTHQAFVNGHSLRITFADSFQFEGLIDGRLAVESHDLECAKRDLIIECEKN